MVAEAGDAGFAVWLCYCSVTCWVCGRPASPAACTWAAKATKAVGPVSSPFSHGHRQHVSPKFQVMGRESAGGSGQSQLLLGDWSRRPTGVGAHLTLLHLTGTFTGWYGWDCGVESLVAGWDWKSHTVSQARVNQEVTGETARCWEVGSENPSTATFHLWSDLILVGISSFPQTKHAHQMGTLLSNPHPCTTHSVHVLKEQEGFDSCKQVDVVKV